MKNLNEDYLIQMYAMARENSGQVYWRGIQDAYHNLLSTFYPGWSAQGTIGHYVFIEGMTYFNATVAVAKHTS
jgi:hypothetical protein